MVYSSTGYKMLWAHVLSSLLSLYWSLRAFRWAPRADREGARSGGLQGPGDTAPRLTLQGSRRGKQKGAGPIAPWLTTEDWHWSRGSYAKLGACSGPSQSHGELGGLQASCSIIRRNFMANKIHLKIRFNAVVLTQTLSLLVNVLSYGYMFAHHGFRRVITILRYLHRILHFCQKKKNYLWEPLSGVQWCWLDKIHIFWIFGFLPLFQADEIFQRSPEAKVMSLNNSFRWDEWITLTLWKAAQSFQAPCADVLRWPLNAPYLCLTIYSMKHTYVVHWQAKRLFTCHIYGFNSLCFHTMYTNKASGVCDECCYFQKKVNFLEIVHNDWEFKHILANCLMLSLKMTSWTSSKWSLRGEDGTEVCCH